MDTTLIQDKIRTDEVYLKDAADNNPVSFQIKKEYEIKDLLKNTSIPFDSKFELKVEANVLKLAYANNKLLSLSNSRTRILAHQVESTHRIINSLNKRFLIADEVGLGKTIEAGLVIKELVLRQGYKRILIVCPASLVMQWQNELQSKFNDDFTIMDRFALKSVKRKNFNTKDNPWHSCDKIICSLDFIKGETNREELSRASWDMVVIDEAHRLRRDDLKSTLSYNAGELLSGRTDSFLLLTATPFRGKLEELYYLIKLVDPNLLGPFQTFYNTFCLSDCDLSKLREKISSVVIRRTKKEIGGFTQRHARTIRFELYPNERVLYDATTRYVVDEYNKAMQSENRAIGFVMTVFQKLLDSSSFALLNTLKKRRTHLSSLVSMGNSYSGNSSIIEKNFLSGYFDIDDPEDLDDVAKQSLKKTFEEIKEEIKILENLIKLAESIQVNKKGEKLKEILHKIKKSKSKKMIIFTQFRTTQDYLKDILSDFRIEIFNGSMNKDEKEKAIQNFKEKADILISTEAGGEGRNLQFCNILINYDLPWSPLKIEQRIGRIHRFGQPEDVFIYNFATKDTVAERILEVLSRKLKLFEESIGMPDILLGQIEEELNLNTLFMKMAVEKSARKINSEIDARLKAARDSYEKLNELAVTKEMDFNYDEYYRITLQEREISNRRIEKFVNSLRNEYPVEKYIGKKNKLTGLYTVFEHINGDKPRKKYGTFDSSRALDNESLEFLAFGNHALDKLVNVCDEDENWGSTGIKIVIYSRDIAGMIFYYKVISNSLSKQAKLMPVFIPENKSVREYEIQEIESLALDPAVKIKSNKSEYQNTVNSIIKNNDYYFKQAAAKIKSIAGSNLINMSDDLNESIKSEIEKINSSFSLKIKEYEEQLERQICHMKWYGKDMKSAITKTRNKILNEINEKESLLLKYRNYLNTNYSIELLSAGILIAVAAL